MTPCIPSFVILIGIISCITILSEYVTFNIICVGSFEYVVSILGENVFAFVVTPVTSNKPSTDQLYDVPVASETSTPFAKTCAVNVPIIVFAFWPSGKVSSAS